MGVRQEFANLCDLFGDLEKPESVAKLIIKKMG